MNTTKITFRYAVACAIAVVFTWILHEFTHWVTNQSLGIDAVMKLNSVSPVPGQDLNNWDIITVAASGPIITILQALVFFFILWKGSWNAIVYPFLFTPFYMRFLAGVFNLIRPNDEGKVSAFLEIGLFTLPLLVSGLLFFLVYKVAVKHQLNWKFQLWTTVLIMFFSSILIMMDQILGIQVIG